MVNKPTTTFIDRTEQSEILLGNSLQPYKGNYIYKLF